MKNVWAFSGEKKIKIKKIKGEWTISRKTREEIEGESNDRPEIPNKEKGGGEREENTILPLGDCPNTHTHWHWEWEQTLHLVPSDGKLINTDNVRLSHKCPTARLPGKEQDSKVLLIENTVSVTDREVTILKERRFPQSFQMEWQLLPYLAHCCAVKSPRELRTFSSSHLFNFIHNTPTYVDF